jgi:hypothetical protein
VAVKPIITMEIGDLKGQVGNIFQKLDASVATIVATTERAMTEVAEDLVAQAQGNINNMSGALSDSATVEQPTRDGAFITLKFGFNSEYGRQRDQGGTIVPRNRQMLAIPLPPIMGASGPKFQSPLDEGVDALDLVPINGRLFLVEKAKGGGKFKASDLDRFHWQLVPEVTQEGSRFFTSVVEARRAEVPVLIAERVAAALGGSA